MHLPREGRSQHPRIEHGPTPASNALRCSAPIIPPVYSSGEPESLLATPQQQCAAIHIHSLLVVLVVVPLVFLWPPERRARRRFQRQLAAAAGDAAAPGAGSPEALAAAAAELQEDTVWSLHSELGTLYLFSCLLWGYVRVTAAPLIAE